MRTALSVIIAACLLAACGVPQKGDYAFIEPSRVQQPSPDKATVYFIRDDNYHSQGFALFVHQEKEKIGVLKPGSYFVHAVNPGEHTFWAKIDSRGFYTDSFRQGEIIYILVTFVSAKPVFNKITKDMALPLIAEHRPTIITEKGKK